MLMYPFMAFSLFRTAMSIGYYCIESNIKADDSTRAAVGTIMANLLVFGIATGNFSAIVMSSFKGQ